MLLLPGRLVGPAEEVVEAEGAARVDGRPEVVRADHDDGRHELRGRVHQQRPLREPHVGRAVGGEASVEPRLLPHPSNGVGAIVDLVHHRIEGAPRSEGAAAPGEETR